MRKIYRISNPPSKTPARSRRDRSVIGEKDEFRYARRLCYPAPIPEAVIVSKIDLKRIIRHAMHAGFSMGRGR